MILRQLVYACMLLFALAGCARLGMGDEKYSKK